MPVCLFVILLLTAAASGAWLGMKVKSGLLMLGITALWILVNAAVAAVPLTWTHPVLQLLIAGWLFLFSTITGHLACDFAARRS